MLLIAWDAFQVLDLRPVVVKRNRRLKLDASKVVQNWNVWRILDQLRGLALLIAWAACEVRRRLDQSLPIAWDASFGDGR